MEVQFTSYRGNVKKRHRGRQDAFQQPDVKNFSSTEASIGKQESS